VTDPELLDRLLGVFRRCGDEMLVQTFCPWLEVDE